MKITLCGSIAFHDEMLNIQKELEVLGHEVKLPPVEVPDGNGNMISVKEYYKLRKKYVNEKWVWERKREAMIVHYDKVAWSDAILVLNYDKNDITGYVGGNTLMEMGLALYLKKNIYLLNNIPQLSYTEEIFGMHPTVLHGDFGKIKR